jgi:hypothetical protein
VRFDLSAWGQTKPPLATWLAEQLTSQYQVPRKLATAWVAEQRILPLLDGLDEVATERRIACVDAINTFQAEDNGLLPLVVCCREQEYSALPLLKLRGAVIAQPLSDAQIASYLAAGGNRLDGVRALIADDPELIAEEAEGGRLLATPLMLSIVTLAYADVPLVKLQGTTHAQRRAEVFDRYIDQAFVRRASDPRYPQATTVQRLRWLAWQLQRNARSTFFMEEMQPDWAGIVWLQRLAFGLLVGLLGALLGALQSPLQSIKLFGLFGGVLGGVLGGDRFYFEVITWSWNEVRPKWRVVLLCVLGGVLGGGMIGMLVSGAIGVLGGVLGGGMIGGMIGALAVGLKLATDIPLHMRPNSGIVSSLHHALIGGLVSGLGAWLINGPHVALVNGRGGFVALVGGLSGLFFGLSAFLKYYILRAFLVQRRLMPWNIIAFCDDCAARALLRRVGGGWIFAHRLLLEHLASQYQPEARNG